MTPHLQSWVVTLPRLSFLFCKMQLYVGPWERQ